MEARLVEALPRDAGWQFEPKWDGFRCLAFRSGEQVRLFAKSGKPLHRYFPEVVDVVRNLPADEFVLDGELVIPVGSTISFDALQLRLHPAESRIRKLSREIPAIFVAFDLIVAPGGRSLASEPLRFRRAELERLAAGVDAPGFRLSPMTHDLPEAEAWLERAGGALDGVIAKRLEGPYQSGERAMLKVKRLRTADCVVGGFRYGANSTLAASLLLGLYNQGGKLDHVGFSTIAPSDRMDLTTRLETLRDGPGFTGNAPGGPSRWSTERTGEYVALRHELVVEVSYDHASGNRFRHGTKVLRWRPDKAPDQCTYEQMQQEAGPDKLIEEVIGHNQAGRGAA